MKNTLLLLLITCFIASCGPSAEEKALMKLKRSSGNAIGIAVLKKQLDANGNVIESNNNCDCDEESFVTYVMPNGCEYIKFNQGGQVWGGHSGTCPNPFHKGFNPIETEPETTTEIIY